ncbi:hypothetical protein [Nodosilinea sp. E11]|uniref:hypothetical protein n=1 Tax=Nodosilinea sp. E11 TaxID=3037479 RepID=UPI00293450BD|nr:hypothetical protein [Nodosilinea sp. E11]WOD38893.1 hypothetical protein RRF56_22060 [Nodosilinea sp. E11]
MGAALSLTWRLVVLGLGMALWGWWLAAFSAPAPIAGVAALLVIYGLAVGWGSVVPASAVISIAITIIIALDLFPAFWPDNSPYKYWAYTVLCLWALSLGVICLLALVGHRLQRAKRAYRWGGRLALLGSLLLSLWGGAMLYQSQWPIWVPW